MIRQQTGPDLALGKDLVTTISLKDEPQIVAPDKVPERGVDSWPQD